MPKNEPKDSKSHEKILETTKSWFIGKLQTERDRARVIDGLNSASNGEFDAKTLAC